MKRNLLSIQWLSALLAVIVIPLAISAQTPQPKERSSHDDILLRKSKVKTLEATGTDIQILNRSPELLASITDKVHREFLDLPSTLTQNSWVAQGKEERTESRTLLSESTDPSLKIHLLTATDGENVRTWHWNRPAIQEENALVQTEPDPIQSISPLSMWMQLTPHPELGSALLDPLLSGKSSWLGKAEYIGAAKLGEVETEIYQLKTNSEIQTWWLAPAFGSVAVKMERRNAETPQSEDAPRAWRHVMVVDKVEQISTLWIPRQVRYFNIITLRSGKKFWELWRQININQVRINQPLNFSPFHLPAPLQTPIYTLDEESGSLYVSDVVGGRIDSITNIYNERLKEEGLKDNDLTELPLTLQSSIKSIP